MATWIILLHHFQSKFGVIFPGLFQTADLEMKVQNKAPRDRIAAKGFCSPQNNLLQMCIKYR